ERLSGQTVTVWFKNRNTIGSLDRDPNEASEQGLSLSIVAKDFDNDGDIDIATGSNNYYIFWNKNNGSGMFNTLVVDANIDDVNALFSADIDNDGDLDLLSSSGKEDRIAWYKNTDAQGN